MSFIVATMKLLHNEPPQITMSNFFIMKLIVPPVRGPSASGGMSACYCFRNGVLGG